MGKQEQTDQRRRNLLWVGVVVLTGIWLTLWSGQTSGSGVVLAQSGTAIASGTAQAMQTPVLPPPACTDPVALTPAMTEGPYYTRNAPERTSLIEPGVKGTKIVLVGYVLTADCKPIEHAWVDFWQADGEGVYDNDGFRLRGHQFTGKDGRYYLETVYPGLYPGRTAHIHVKVQAPNQSVLTSQIFFPGEVRNSTDSIFSTELLAAPLNPATGQLATLSPLASTPAAGQSAQPPTYVFNFVLDVRSGS